MSIRSEIEKTFEGKAFERPLFYSYPTGLRFELSEGGHFINQFLMSMKKGEDVCREIFFDEKQITVCLKMFVGTTLLKRLSDFRELRYLNILPTKVEEYWREENDDPPEDEKSWWDYFVFKLPIEYLPNLLWTAFSTDFGAITPNPGVDVYLFSLSKKIMVFPYDDRGMDVVGPNKDYLHQLYTKFNRYLLNYDRVRMDEVFKKTI